MDRFEIRCTEEQTLKAIKLDAPILVTPAELYEELPHFNMAIDGENASIIIPTAEQMLGWLEEQEPIKEVCVLLIGSWEYIISNGSENPLCGFDFNTRKEATIAAIDAALEYLSNKEK